ncbi:MAG: hypothetical protein QOG54_1048 [Actinomycetota bacterium]|jgi:hypothetical protein|nr:hypothetical protein [Actinomycetota bacterium]
MRELREPDAIPIVQNGRLRMGVRRFTRSHDKVQILDNAKHVLFSTKTFEVPADGALSLSATIDATGSDCVDGDLYDGFASLLCLDFSTGTAIDVFCRDDLCAAVFARLPFPGISVPEIQPMKYWGIFDERELSKAGPHDYTIVIDNSRRAITWTVDGESLREQSMPDYEIGPLMLGLGLMTEKDIGTEGSISVHGQGVKAEWSPITITQILQGNRA